MCSSLNSRCCDPTPRLQPHGSCFLAGRHFAIRCRKTPKPELLDTVSTNSTGARPARVVTQIQPSRRRPTRSLCRLFALRRHLTHRPEDSSSESATLSETASSPFPTKPLASRKSATVRRAYPIDSPISACVWQDSQRSNAFWRNSTFRTPRAVCRPRNTIPTFLRAGWVYWQHQ